MRCAFVGSSLLTIQSCISTIAIAASFLRPGQMDAHIAAELLSEIEAATFLSGDQRLVASEGFGDADGEWCHVEGNTGPFQVVSAAYTMPYSDAYVLSI